MESCTGAQNVTPLLRPDPVTAAMQRRLRGCSCSGAERRREDTAVETRRGAVISGPAGSLHGLILSLTHCLSESLSLCLVLIITSRRLVLHTT